MNIEKFLENTLHETVTIIANLAKAEATLDYTIINVPDFYDDQTFEMIEVFHKEMYDQLNRMHRCIMGAECSCVHTDIESLFNDVLYSIKFAINRLCSQMTQFKFFKASINK